MKTEKEIEDRLFQLREELANAEADLDYFEKKAEAKATTEQDAIDPPELYHEDARITYIETKEAIAHLEWVLSESEDKGQKDKALKSISGLLNIASGLILLGLMAYIIFSK